MAIRRLLRYLLPKWQMVCAAFLFLILATATDLTGPYLVKVFIDNYLMPRKLDFGPIFSLALLYLGLLVASSIFYYLQIFMFNKIALKVIQQLRIELFNNVQKLSLQFFDHTPAGELISKISNDTEAIKDLFVSVLGMLVQNIAYILGIYIAMFLLNPRLAGLCLIFVPIIATLMVVYTKLSSKVYTIAREKLAEINTKLSEALQGMQIIQAFNQEKRLKADFNTTNTAYFRQMQIGVKLNARLLRSAISVVYIATIILTLSYFGLVSFEHTIQVGVLIAFLNYLDRIFEPINMVMERLMILQQARVAAVRVFALIDTKEYEPAQQGEEQSKIMKGKVEFKNVSFSYDGREQVLQGISFTAKPGETIALVGHTGSGKSTISNLLMNFYSAQEGEILIDNIPINAFTAQELRSNVGLVLQDPFIFHGSVEENIGLKNPLISDKEIRQAAKLVQAHSFIESLKGGYQEHLGERGANLSTGQRQLICFARAIVRNPKILILDEATANIDTETEDMIQTTLKQMRAGRTTIAIAHRLSTIMDADQILVLHKGKLVEKGKHEELLTKQGLYYKMFLMQQSRYEKGRISS